MPSVIIACLMYENFVQHAVELVPRIHELVQVVKNGLRVRVLVLRADGRHVHQGLLLR